MEKNDTEPDDLLSLGYEYYKEIYRSSPIGIELFDEKGVLLHANPASLNIFGVSRVEDLRGFKFFDDANIPSDAHQRLMNGETLALTKSFNFDLIRRDGGYAISKIGSVYLDILITALKKPDNEIRGYLVQVQDVTEQRRAKEQLDLYQRQLERIVDARTDQLEHVNIQLQRELQERRRIAAVEQKQRALADALRNTVMALTSTLRFEEVIDQILSHIGGVIPYDAVILLMLDNGNLRQVGSRGFSDEETCAFMRGNSVSVQTYPNLVSSLNQKEPVLIHDVREYVGWVFNEEISWIASNITTPIISRDVVLGFINIYSREAGYYSEEHVSPLVVFAHQAAIAIRNARLYEDMQRLAIIDELTGIYNRRGLYEFGLREVSRVQRFKRPLTALFFDIDHFKQFNDRYSYAVGDQVLRFLTEHLKSRLRDVDLLARYGGEEFVALLPEIGLEDGAEIAERLRAEIENACMRVGADDLHITISIGIAPLIAKPKQTDLLAGRERELLHDLIQRAGKKLHEAKENGRNRIAF